METDERPREVLPPPPKSRKKGWKPVDGDPTRVRWWDGKQWTDRYETAADAGRFLESIFPQERPPAGWFLGIIVSLLAVLLIVAVWAGLIGGGDDEGTEPAGSNTTTTLTPQAAAGDPKETPVTPSAGATTQEQESPAGETPGACVARTFNGGAEATFDNAVGSATQHASSQVIIGPDCTAKVELVLLESGASDAYFSSNNPEGNFCAMVEGEGTLTFTPDGQGGGTLAGTLMVYPNVASSHHFNGLCPEPHRVGSYVLEGVAGDFSGSITGSTLSGSGTFAHRQLPVGVSITAAEGS